MFNAKYFDVEIPLDTLTMLERAEKFQEWLIDNDYKIEISECFNRVHFEIFIETSEKLHEAEKALDDIVYFDAF